MHPYDSYPWFNRVTPIVVECLRIFSREEKVEKLKTLKLVVLLMFLVLQSGCGTLPDNTDRTKSHALGKTGETFLGRTFRQSLQTHAGQSGFLPLGTGLDAFTARAILANSAEQSIDAQYFLLHDDLVGRLFMSILIQAADRGVRVRLLIDDVGWGGFKDNELSSSDLHPNFEIRIFNPFSRRAPRFVQYLSRLRSVSRRMHNKSFIVDNQAVILGGRNIGNEYFEAHPDVAFGDLDVFTIGSVVKEVSHSFDQYWNSDLSYSISKLTSRLPTDEKAGAMRKQLNEYIAEYADSDYVKALRNSNLARSIENNSLQLHWGHAKVVVDAPEKLSESRMRTDLHLSKDLSSHFARARKEIIIFTPYFIPGEFGVEALSKLVAKGVRVQILTNSLSSNNHKIVHAHYAKYRKALLTAGVELYEVSQQPADQERQRTRVSLTGAGSAVLHAKTFVFDRKHVFIGSLNFDPRSFVENTEIGIIFESNDMARDMAEWFDQNIGQLAYRLQLIPNNPDGAEIIWEADMDGDTIRLDIEPDSTSWQRLKMAFWSLLPIESML